MNPSDEWELSKENVQPLKHGRRVTSLTTALQPHNVDQHQQLILQRQAKEAALRSYTGEDPLEPWDDYIKWTEQAYPNGGKDSNLQVLLEKCLSTFKDEVRYKNDVRYVGCWIKLANHFFNNPLEIFQFMRDQSIGTALSAFYEAWSSELEQRGNSKKADAVYREGLACHAQPRDRLEAAHREFQSRVARETMSKIQEGAEAAGFQGEQREQLGELRGKGRHQKVSSQRVGSAKQANKGGLVLAPPSQLGNSFVVFCDDASGGGVGPSSLPAPTGEWERMPVHRETQKENVQEAGPWAGQKVRQQRTGGIAVSQLAAHTQPAFKVHVDETAPEITTPRRMPETGSQVLSAHKPDRPSNLLQHIAQQPVGDDKTKAMYCKHLIYNGATEMSFEELRAIKYNARREARKLEEEKAALEKQRAEYRAMMRQQQEAMEQQMQQQRLMHQQQLEEQRRVQQQLQQQMEQQLQQQMQQMQLKQKQQQLQQQQQQAAVQPQQIASRQQLTDPVHQAVALPQESGPSIPQNRKPDSEPRDPTVTRQLMYEETGNQAHWMDASNSSATRHPTPSSARSAVGNLNTSQITPGSAPAATGSSAPNLSQARTPAEHRGAPTPGSSHSRNASGLSLSLSRSRLVTPSRTPGCLTRPSPTLHTKEAISVVMDMLNKPLGDDDDFLWAPRHQLASAPTDDDFEANFANTDSRKSQPQSFPDFASTANSGVFTAASKGATSGPAFTIFNESETPSGLGHQANQGSDDYLDNQENMPPKDFVKPRPDDRQKLGVLQPAQGIPFMSLEEQEKAAGEEDEQGLAEQMEVMDGVQPLPADGSRRPDPSVLTAQQDINETILNHQDAHSAFKAASRMASTPFTSSGVLCFPPLSSIKPSLPGVPGLNGDATLQDASMGGEAGRPAALANRIMIASVAESFDATECTMNADSQQKLSPIMERSNEDARSSASSSSNSTGPAHPSSTTHSGASSTHHAALSALQAGLSTTFDPPSTSHEARPTCFGFPPTSRSILADASGCSTTIKGTPSVHPAAPSTIQAGLSTTFEHPSALSSSRISFPSTLTDVLRDANASLSTKPQKMSSVVGLHTSSTSNHVSLASSGKDTLTSLSAVRHTSFNTSDAPLSTSQSGLSATTTSFQVAPSATPSLSSLPSTGLDSLDMSHVSVRRGNGNHHTWMDCTEMPDEPSVDSGGPSVTGGGFIDPFSDDLKAELLCSLPRPLTEYDGYAECDYPMPELVLSEAVGLGDELYTVDKVAGEGAFAKIYQASILSLHTGDLSHLLSGQNDKLILKVQKPPCPWEFYISRALHERLDSLRSPVDVRASVMYANNMHVFPDGSCLVTKHHRNLTLLHAVNEYNKAKTVMPEELVLLLTIEILHVVEQVHACGVIHADIKPDNFLLIFDDDDDDDGDEGSDDGDSGPAVANTRHVKLVDFGRSIDMQLFPRGTTFVASCDTDGFMCPEMQSSRPWTYQTDLFGVAATVHCLMFGSYMHVYKEKGHWKHTSSVKRCYKAKWRQFFDTLLNIPSCEALPSLAELRRDLEESLTRIRTNLDAKINKLASMLFTR